jgi:hypothetical protein
MDKIAQQFIQQAFIAKRNSDQFHDRLLREIRKLNRKVNKVVRATYGAVVDHLDTFPNSQVIESTIDNLEKLSNFMPHFDEFLMSYGEEFQKIYDSMRFELFHQLKDKEQRLMKVLEKMGIKDDRVTASEGTLALMNEIVGNLYRNIDLLRSKWRSYVYDTIFNGITSGSNKQALKESLLTELGNIKIGSSMEEMSEAEASKAAIRERIAYVQQQAKENGYKYCWNVNPMDALTKPICAEATMAGVIKEEEMGNVYGFPPRFICRCDIAYTRGEWTEFNQAINTNLREVKKRWVQELIDAPHQKASWFRGMTLVIPSDPVRAAGEKLYADIKEKLDLANKTDVPDFEQ